MKTVLFALGLLTFASPAMAATCHAGSTAYYRTHDMMGFGPVVRVKVLAVNPPMAIIQGPNISVNGMAEVVLTALVCAN